MAFLEKEDLYSVIREYQLDALTDSDDDIITDAIEIAMDAITNIFTPNEMTKWKDGRVIYDIAAEFGKTGDDRHKFLLARTKIFAVWELSILSNAGLDYTQLEARYNDCKQDLEDIASGVKNSATLAKVAAREPDDELPWASGSRCKFHHE